MDDARRELERLYIQSPPLEGAELAQLESDVDADPDNPLLRARLLGSLSKSPRHLYELSRAFPHVLWWIRNHPDVHIGGHESSMWAHAGEQTERTQLIRAWESAVAQRPNDAEVLDQAATFWLFLDIHQAWGLLQRAHRVAPANGAYATKLAHSILLHSSKRETSASGWREYDRAGVAAAMSWLQVALESAKDMWRENPLRQACKTALILGDFAQARTLAEELMQRTTLYGSPNRNGNPHFYAHQTLGHVALADGDVDRAKNHLVESARIQGSPNLNSFGPDFALAHALVERGEKAAVREYVDLCAKFWRMDGGRLDKWRRYLDGGFPPEGAPDMLR